MVFECAKMHFYRVTRRKECMLRKIENPVPRQLCETGAHIPFITHQNDSSLASTYADCDL